MARKWSIWYKKPDGGEAILPMAAMARIKPGPRVSGKPITITVNVDPKKIQQELSSTELVRRLRKVLKRRIEEDVVSVSYEDILRNEEGTEWKYLVWIRPYSLSAVSEKVGAWEVWAGPLELPAAVQEAQAMRPKCAGVKIVPEHLNP